MIFCPFFLDLEQAFQDRSPILPKNSKRWKKNPGIAKKEAAFRLHH
jgi:hypothetical protein